jgi:nucleoside-diphosphate-sugar epimerase
MMFLKGKEIFLAGATGLAGASIMAYLLENHPETTIRASCFHTEPFIRHERLTYVRGDLRSRDDCRRMVRGCGGAILAAATTGGALSAISAPWEQVSDNVTLDVQLLHALHLEQIPRVVFVSTASVYQDFEGAIREEQLDMNREPHPAYLGIGWAKRYVEKLCRFWYEKAGMEVVIARSSNIYGPFAKFDPAVSHFVPALIRKAADGLDPFEVWGNPGVARDIIYGEDFARAVVLMLDRANLKFDIFNVGSGVRTSVGDAVGWALKHAGHNPGEVLYREDRPTTIPFRVLDCSRIKEKLGWEPECSPEEGIRRTTQWWLQNRSWWKR